MLNVLLCQRSSVFGQTVSNKCKLIEINISLESLRNTIPSKNKSKLICIGKSEMKLGKTFANFHLCRYTTISSFPPSRRQETHLFAPRCDFSKSDIAVLGFPALNGNRSRNVLEDGRPLFVSITTHAAGYLDATCRGNEKSKRCSIRRASVVSCSY